MVGRRGSRAFLISGDMNVSQATRHTPIFSVMRDRHPVRPFVVRRNGEPIGRFNTEFEAMMFLWRSKTTDEALRSIGLQRP